MNSLSREISVVRAAVRQAAAHIMRVYARPFSVDDKGGGDPVTDADRGANAIIVGALGTAFPTDNICAEESLESDSRLAASRGGRCWFVDPLDGTREFVSRNGEFAIMVGLAIDGHAVLGVVYAPALGTEWWGVPSVGAWRATDGVSGEHAITCTSVLQTETPVRFVASRSNLGRTVSRVVERLQPVLLQQCGSVGLKAARVIDHHADLYLHAGRGPKLWDVCAPEAIARGAGALFTDGVGKPFAYVTSQIEVSNGIVCTGDPALLTRAVSALSDVQNEA